MAEQKWADGIDKIKEMSDKIRRTCPLRDSNPCNEKYCAWWNPIDEECSIVTLATVASIDVGGREGL